MLEQTYWIIGPYDIVAIMEALLLDTLPFGTRLDRCCLPYTVACFEMRAR